MSETQNFGYPQPEEPSGGEERITDMEFTPDDLRFLGHVNIAGISEHESPADVPDAARDTVPAASDLNDPNARRIELWTMLNQVDPAMADKVSPLAGDDDAEIMRQRAARRERDRLADAAEDENPPL